MSSIGGCSSQPDRLTTTLTSTGAPQFGQLCPLASLGSRQ